MRVSYASGERPFIHDTRELRIGREAYHLISLRARLQAPLSSKEFHPPCPHFLCYFLPPDSWEKQTSWLLMKIGGAVPTQNSQKCATSFSCPWARWIRRPGPVRDVDMCSEAAGPRRRRPVQAPPPAVATVGGCERRTESGGRFRGILYPRPRLPFAVARRGGGASSGGAGGGGAPRRCP